MTLSPHVAQPDTTLAAAHRTMHRLGIRHLPVLRDLRVVGIVTDRDLSVCELVPNAEPDRITVEEIMIRDVLAVPPEATVEDVAAQMRTRNCGSAVVVDHDRVVGIFTTSDALTALSEIIERECGA
jgi:acetoin utilization protein AcuB